MAYNNRTGYIWFSHITISVNVAFRRVCTLVSNKLYTDYLKVIILSYCQFVIVKIKCNNINLTAQQVLNKFVKSLVKSFILLGS